MQLKQFVPIGARKTMQETIADSLRTAIVQGVLKPGERLDQTELATLFGISRVPIREALRTLEAEGLVTVYPYRWAEVSVLSPDEIKEIYQIRANLEAMALRLAIPNLNEDLLQELQAFLDEMVQALEEPVAWASLNRRFHQTLYHASGRARLCNIIEMLRNTVQPYVVTDVSLPGRAQVALGEHRELLRLCMEQDLEGAESLLRQHLLHVSDAVVEYFQRRGSTLDGRKGEE